MNIFNSLLPQLVKYDVHTTRKINSIHAIFYHILSFYLHKSVKKWNRNAAAKLRRHQCMQQSHTRRRRTAIAKYQSEEIDERMQRTSWASNHRAAWSSQPLYRAREPAIAA